MPRHWRGRSTGFLRPSPSDLHAWRKLGEMARAAAEKPEDVSRYNRLARAASDVRKAIYPAGQNTPLSPANQLLAMLGGEGEHHDRGWLTDLEIKNRGAFAPQLADLACRLLEAMDQPLRGRRADIDD